MNNKVYDEKSQSFVYKTNSEDTRPKKFQKEYLKKKEAELIAIKKEELENQGFNKTEINEKIKSEEIQKEIFISLTPYKNECKNALKQWIKFCKDFCDSYPSVVKAKYDFKDTFTLEQNDLYEFYKQLSGCLYKIEFCDISESYIDKMVKEGKLYLFEIYSKDFSKRSKGTHNLQTLYWKALFDEENLKNVVYKLNGDAELFFREASLEYNDEIWKKGHHYEEKLKDTKKKNHLYPVIKDRRYAQDTYLFYVPITCNAKARVFTASSFVRRFNDKVLKTLKENKEQVHIIGIDRGERHLAYYTVIDPEGNIVEQASLNNPLGKKDYHDLLATREEERDKARKSWGTIEKIKDLKEGYLSQVVHKICQLMLQYNAIVVFEDLNFGFKKGRFKVEKQVYQKLEKMLIDKLNYLVMKDKKIDKEEAGVLNALQLTAPFQSFSKIGKQTGFIFYVPAYHTSKICPATGFVNLLYPRYETIPRSQDFFKKFDKICFNGTDFEFHFNYEEFKSKKQPDKSDGSKQKWVVYSHGKRLENFRDKEKNNQWATREVDLNKELRSLFSEYKIPLKNNECIKEEIAKKTKSEFFKELMRLLKLTLQMRNSRIGSDEDYLISPVKDKDGNFFDSREEDKETNPKMPRDADANGAYHIALKGLQLLKQLEDTEEVEKFKPDMTNKSWYKFVQNKNTSNIAGKGTS